MIKSALKWIFGILGSLILLLVVAYGGFHLWEYASGGKYVQYLTENSETIPLEQQFSYQTMESDLSASKLIMVGEIHGFGEPCKFDVDFFKYLHKNHGVRHYVAELDFVQALLLNDYLQSGDEELLSDILKNWAVEQGRNNKSYFDKYRAFHAYYSQLPDDEKFEFIGVDKTQDLALTASYVNSLLPNGSTETTVSTDIDSTLHQIETLKSIYSHSPDMLFVLTHIASNLMETQNRGHREDVMFGNFYKLYKQYNLAERKVYGYFGLFHAFQYRVNGQHPLASQIRMSDLGLADHMLSITFLLNDSYMAMASNALPEFLRDKGPYSRMPVSADNMLIMYMYGIKDFKRMTPEHHKSLIKMNAEPNPYAETTRMLTTFQVLPVTDLFEMNDAGKPYTQYTLFVRNSDWAEPME